MTVDWIELNDEKPEVGAFIVTAENFDNTGSPIYDLIQVTEHTLDCMTFTHWSELLAPEFSK